VRAGRGVCKDLSCQKARVGEGGGLERALIDVTGTGKTVPSCREKRFAKNLCKRCLNSPTVVKVFENKFGQVAEKFFESVLCLFGFVKQQNSENRANIRIAFKMLGERVASLVKLYT